jgi:hypothetical protein
MMLSLTVATPIAWEHHYGILLPIVAIVVPTCLSERLFGRWTILSLVVVFFLSSQRLDIFHRFAETPLNILQSHVLFAGIMTLFLLYRVSRKNTVSTSEQFHR